MLARGTLVLTAIALLLLCSQAAAGTPELVVEFPRTAGTVGDRFPMTINATGADSGNWESIPLQEQIGPFHVLDGAWRKLDHPDGDDAWVWSGNLAAYEPGDLELPAFAVRFRLADEVLEATTEPFAVTIESVLAEEGQDAELADLKGPAAVNPDYGALFLALAVLAGLFGAAGSVWWIQRRLAGKLAAVPQPADPFQRMPPHEWAYQALQDLLRSGRADPEHAGPFFQEIARILKLYLGGRFRIELLECTTSEVAPLLGQAGAGEDPIRKAERILLGCDMVKFAGHRPDPAAFRTTVEEAYALGFSDAPVPASELRVISYVLPQTAETCADQRQEKVVPAERWARSRFHGEEFNCDLRLHLAATLNRAGFPAVAPERLPGFAYRQSECFGLASNWSERHAAFIAGHGTFSLSDAMITRWGKAVRFGSVVCRIDLPATERAYGEDLHAWCLWYAKGTCGACAKRCPADAITTDGGHDKPACFSYIRETTAPYATRTYGTGATPCGLCQVKIPCESRVPPALS